MDWSELVIIFLFCGIFGRYMVYEPYPWRMLQSLTYQVKICKNKRFWKVISHFITKKQNLPISFLFFSYYFRGSLGFSDEFTRVLMGNVGDMDVKVKRSD